ncbi:hypothetical protein QE152_g17062 [Popillia japonica]|uniref:Uncharacterized protein n=1 Tax=Popillia japonica TaxID=7064 RepID=A0AAW1L567_POPJA
MRANPGSRINNYDIAKLVADAYKQVCFPDIAENGFMCTGMYPINPNIFTDLDFMSSQLTHITDLSLTEPVAVGATIAASGITSLMCAPSSSYTSTALSSSPQPPILGVAGSSAASAYNIIYTLLSVPTSTVTKTLPSTSTQSEFASILKQLSCLPSYGEKRLKSRKRKATKCDILISTPVKNMLIEKTNAV